uniref:Putative transmembrane protein 167 n=1 Tax=Ixodes ricinus TaxID=34613 RepID=A0A147BMW9_IXORI
MYCMYWGKFKDKYLTELYLPLFNFLLYFQLMLLHLVNCIKHLLRATLSSREGASVGTMWSCASLTSLPLYNILSLLPNYV